jgi:hypothetical protein
VTPFASTVVITHPSAMTTPEVPNEQTAGYIVASRAASRIGGAGNDGQHRIPDELRRAERSRPSCILRDRLPAGRKLIALPFGMYEDPPARAA